MTKWKLFTSILTALTLTLGMDVTRSQSSYAQSERPTYFCGTVNGVSTTLARAPGGINHSLISWKRSLGKYSPQQRCQIISDRFQTYYSQGLLKFMRTGVQNRQAVLCVASYKDGPCRGVLMTLRSRDEAESIRQRLLNSGVLAEGAISQGEGGLVYVDIEKYLETGSSGESDTPLLEF